MTLQRQYGVTLLEIMLVLTIVATVMLMGVRQYRHYLWDRDVAQTQSNVNLLFAGLKKYYQATCENRITRAIDIEKELIKLGFLERWPPQLTRFINNTDPTVAYIAQLNVGSPTTRRVYACWDLNGVHCTDPQPLPSATVFLSRLQVAIRLPAEIKDKAVADSYQKQLGADCVSTLQGQMVTPCGATPPKDNFYLVWERLPSFATEQTTSSLWVSTPLLQQFKQQYDNKHDTYYEFINPSYTQDYLCGG